MLDCSLGCRYILGLLRRPADAVRCLPKRLWVLTGVTASGARERVQIYLYEPVVCCSCAVPLQS